MTDGTMATARPSPLNNRRFGLRTPVRRCGVDLGPEIKDDGGLLVVKEAHEPLVDDDGDVAGGLGLVDEMVAHRRKEDSSHFCQPHETY